MRKTDPAGDKPYALRLGVTPPSVQDVIARADKNLMHLMVAALLEFGGPLTLDELAQRLERAGVRSRIGDLRTSIKKAWAGRGPIYRDIEGRFALNLQCDEMRFLLWDLGLRQSAPKADPPPVVQSLPEPPPEVPLTPEEIEAALRDASLFNYAHYRQVAAVLDAFGSPQAMADVESVLAGYTQRRYPFSQRSAHQWRNRLVGIGTDGLFHLNPSGVEMLPLREEIRAMARSRVQAATNRLQAEAAVQGARAKELQEELVRDAAERHAVVRLAELASGAPFAAALLDVERREIQTFLIDELAEFAEALTAYDVLAGLDIRSSLELLRLAPDGWRHEELRPNVRSMRLNRAGGRLKVTFELVSMSTTRISRPLGDLRKMREYVATGQSTRLRKRLASDVKGLFALRQYAALHGYVRLQWGFLDELLALEWRAPRAHGIAEQMREAAGRGEIVDIVVGSAPGWEEPWSRARKGRVLRASHDDALVVFGEPPAHIEDLIPFREIQAVRRLD